MPRCFLFCLSGYGDTSPLARSVMILKFADQCQLTLQQYSKSADILCADEFNLQGRVSASSPNCNCTSCAWAPHYIKAGSIFVLAARHEIVSRIVEQLLTADSYWFPQYPTFLCGLYGITGFRDITYKSLWSIPWDL